MGLDMYLTKKTYVGAKWDHSNVKGSINITKGDDNKPVNVNFKRVSYIEEEIGYWRKANQIHRWFVENVQKNVDDCGTYYVDEEKLRELLTICKLVKEASVLKDGAITNGYVYENGVKMPIVEEGKVIVNEEKAAELLPTASGFFFGGTDYDQYYMNDIDDTIEILESVLANDLDGDIYYHASW